MLRLASRAASRAHGRLSRYVHASTKSSASSSPGRTSNTSSIATQFATAAGLIAVGVSSFLYAEDLSSLIGPIPSQVFGDAPNEGGDHSTQSTQGQGNSNSQEDPADLAFKNLHTLLNLPISYKKRIVVDGILYGSASALSPHERDNTGVAHVSWAFYCRNPVLTYCMTGFSATPTHAVTTTILLQGEQASPVGDMLSEAIALSVRDTLDSYAVGSGLGLESSYSADGGGAMSLETLKLAPRTQEFTPDVVRPVPPAKDMVRAIKRAFIGVDYRLVYSNAEEVLRLAKAQKSGVRGLKDQGLVATRAAASLSTGLAGSYESDTRVYTVALVGEARAVLGRAVRNPSYTSSPSSESDAPRPASGEPGSNTYLRPLERNEYPTLYCPVNLTADQCPSNSNEVERLQKEHQGRTLFFDDKDAPPTVPKRKTYLGLSTTRAFGLGSLKWSLDYQKHVQEEFFGEAIPGFFQDGTLPGPPGAGPPDLPPQGPTALSSPQFSPVYKAQSKPPTSSPYLTAEPEVTRVKIEPGDFIVLGTKGLFECLSTEEVVGLVGIWMEERRRLGYSPESLRNIRPFRQALRDPARGSGVDLYGPDDYPAQLLRDVQTIGSYDEKGQYLILQAMAHHGQPRKQRLVDKQQLPIIASSPGALEGDQELVEIARTNERLNSERKPFRYLLSWNVPDPTFVFDERDFHCVAVHILRNALGGNREDLAEALFSTSAAQAPKLMDDSVGLTVIFFD